MLLTPITQHLLTMTMSYAFGITTLLCVYPLLGEPIPEWTVYRTNGNFHLTSTHYARITALLLIRLAQLPFIPYTPYFWSVFWTLMITGLLNNPFVMILYFMEQIQIFCYGASARASDLRIIAYFLLNTACFVGSLYLTDTAEYLVPIFGYLMSNSLLWTVGVARPFKVVNEQLAQAKVLNDIVFAEIKMPVGVPGENKWQRNQIIVRKVLEIIVFLVIVFTAKSYVMDFNAM
jgi:hypothetical protein